MGRAEAATGIPYIRGCLSDTKIHPVWVEWAQELEQDSRAHDCHHWHKIWEFLPRSTPCYLCPTAQLAPNPFILIIHIVSCPLSCVHYLVYFTGWHLEEYTPIITQFVDRELRFKKVKQRAQNYIAS